jgi:hypothetical protein
MINTEHPFPARPMNGGNFHLDKLAGDWLYQPKYNGWRALIDLQEDRVFNRHGEPMSIGDCFKRAIDSIRGNCLNLGIYYLDAEALERRFDPCRGALILLDLPDSPDSLETRMEAMSFLASKHDINKFPAVSTVLSTPTFDENTARLFWLGLQRLNKQWGAPIYEGLVAKKVGTKYPTTSKRTDTSKDWVKFRFD